MLLPLTKYFMGSFSQEQTCLATFKKRDHFLKQGHLPQDSDRPGPIKIPQRRVPIASLSISLEQAYTQMKGRRPQKHTASSTTHSVLWRHLDLPKLVLPRRGRHRSSLRGVGPRHVSRVTCSVLVPHSLHFCHVPPSNELPALTGGPPKSRRL